MALIDYLLRHRDAQGIEKIVIMVQLRDYVNRANTLDLMEEIGAIWDERDLKVLVAAGIKKPAYYALMAQMAKALGVA